MIELRNGIVFLDRNVDNSLALFVFKLFFVLPRWEKPR